MTNRVGPFDLLSVRRPDTSLVNSPRISLAQFIRGRCSERLYRMDGPTGTIMVHEDFEAGSDDEAIGRALEEAGEQRIELWHNGRKITAISGEDEPTELRIAPPTD